MEHLVSKDMEVNGRVLSIVFDNNTPGDHNKMMLIAIPGTNSASSSTKAKAQANEIQAWVKDKRTIFSKH